MRLRKRLLAVIAALGSSCAFAQDVRTVEIDCGADRTIAQALASGNQAKALEIVVRGTCNESVQINRDDVTIRAEPTGGQIHGLDPLANVVVVTGARVTLDGLTVTGGRNGIVGTGALNLTVRNVTVRDTTRNGIVYSGGSSGTIDHCTLQSNPRDGASIEASTVTIINSTMSGNGRFGVLLAIGATARIGVNTRNAAAGNTISNNVNSGITLGAGSTALIGANEITNNGGQGISVTEGRAELAGLNNITGNTLQGVFARAATVQIGGPALDFATTNTISGNGSAPGPGGIFATLGASLVVRNATISNNFGFGLGLDMRSQVQIFGSMVTNNSGNGIQLGRGSALVSSPPTTTISGNTGVGLQCFDFESSVANLFSPPPPLPPAPPTPAPPIPPSTLSIFGNTGGDVSFSCTSF